MKIGTIIGLSLWSILGAALGFMGINVIDDPLKFIVIMLIVGGIEINCRVNG